MHVRGEYKQEDGIPADDAHIKEVNDPQPLLDPHGQEDCHDLAHEDSTGSAEDASQVRDQRIHFESSVMKCDKRRDQV